MSYVRLTRVLNTICLPLVLAGLICAFFGLSGAPALAWDVTLAWDPNQEPDLDGYTVYFTKHSPGPPYDYVGDLSLSELGDPNTPVVILTNLEKHVDYFFALTAYDIEGNESSFSQELCVRADETIHECVPAASSGLSGGGNHHSSSMLSSACFIQSAAGGGRSSGLSNVLYKFLELIDKKAVD